MLPLADIRRSFKFEELEVLRAQYVEQRGVEVEVVVDAGGVCVEKSAAHLHDAEECGGGGRGGVGGGGGAGGDE